jgi:hypothetical protein
MSNDIQLDDRLLAPGLIAAALSAVAVWPTTLNALAATAAICLGVFVITTMVIAVVLIPVAWFVNLRDAEGLGTKGATFEYARRLVLYGAMTAIVTFAYKQLHDKINDTPVGWALGAIVVYFLVRDAVQSFRQRKQRAGLKTIDLSKSRELK